MISTTPASPRRRPFAIGAALLFLLLASPVHVRGLVADGPGAANDPPIVTIHPMDPVTATTPAGAQMWLLATVTDPDGDPLLVTWNGPFGEIQFEVFSFFSTNAAVLVDLPIGSHEVSITADDRNGNVVVEQAMVVVSGENTGLGTAIELEPTDANLPIVFEFTPGRMRLRFDNITAAGLTHFSTRTDQAPPAPGGWQPASGALYYDAATTTSGDGNVRVCVNTTGMSFANPGPRLHHRTTSSWTDVTTTAMPEEIADGWLCGMVPFAQSLGTFAVFTPANEAARVTTVAGNGELFQPATPAPGDGGPATAAPVTAFHIALDRQRNYLYLAGMQVRRIDLATNIITTIGGTDEYESIEPRLGEDARLSFLQGNYVSVDAEGHVFVDDVNGCGVLRIDRATNILTRVVGRGPDEELNCAYDGDGGAATSAGIGLAAPVAFDAAGNMFLIQIVYGTNGFVIRRIAAGADGLITGDDPDEIITTIAGGGETWPPAGDPREAMLQPQALAFGPSGDLYMGASAFVLRLSPAPGQTLIDGRDGELLSIVGGRSILRQQPFQGDGGHPLDANFAGAWGIAVKPNGDVVVGDIMSGRIRQISAGADGIVNGSPDERVTTIAGFTENNQPFSRTFNGDGYALATIFADPRGIVAEPNGSILVADLRSNRVRRIGPAAPVADPEADLVLGAFANPLTVGVGSPVEYLVVVSNSGPSPVSSFSVSMPGGPGYTLGTITAPNGTCIINLFTRQFDCHVAATIAPGTHYTMTVEITPTTAGTLTKTFSVVSSTSDPDLTNNEAGSTVTVVAAADVAVSVVPSRTLVHIGDAFSYAVTVTNNGPSPGSGIEIAIVPTAGFLIDSVDLPGFSCIGIIGLPSMRCHLADLQPGTQTTFTVSGHTTSGPTASTTFTVSATQHDPSPGNNSVAVDVAVNGPPIVDAGPDREVLVGTSPAGIPVSAAVSDPDGDAIVQILWPGGRIGPNVELLLEWGTHVITVVATDGRGGVGSDTVTITVRPTALAAPQTVAAESTDPGTVALSWTAVPGAEAYRIYRDPDPVTFLLPPSGPFILTGNAQLVATVAGTSHVNMGLPPLVRQHYAVIAVNGGVSSLPTPAAPVVVRAEPDAEIFGFADTHNHQFANLGFGGGLIWGQAFHTHGVGEALRHCTEVHGVGGFLDPLGNFLTGSPFGHDTGGFSAGSPNQFPGWPWFNTRTHQQVYHESLRRAFDGGQRLMVMHALSNEVLCQMTPNSNHAACEDMASIPAQINAAKALEAFIDTQSGGPGRGWYRIAYSGSQAREIINSGKMAVVLGIEVDELFSCGRNATCTMDDVRRRLDEYHAMGVRHLFPVGHYDNAFGGAAMYSTIFSFGNWVATNDFLQARECGPEGYTFAPNAAAEGVVWNALRLLIPGLGGFPAFPDPPFVSDCNVRGLTGLGDFLVREMMARGMIIDIDHMSSLAANRVLQIAEEEQYPAIVSGHSSPLTATIGSKRNEGAKTVTQVQRIAALGGLSSVILSQGDRATAGNLHGVPQYAPSVINDCGNSSKTLAQAYIAAVDGAGGPLQAAVGFGSDFNGLGGQPGPRFGSFACSGDPSPSPQANPVVYPFPIVAPTGVNAGSLTMSAMPPRISNNLPVNWNFNTDGLAHAGMVPDLIDDLRRVGVSDAYLRPLFRSAEAYVSMWEQAEGGPIPLAVGTLVPPGSGTYTASNVAGEPQPVTVTLANVSIGGYLIAEEMETPPPAPSGYVVVGAVLDLILTVPLPPPARVCLQGNFAAGDRLMHFELDAWVDITDDEEASDVVICGDTSSFSPFAVMRPSGSANTAPTADAGGPYAVVIGQPLTFAGSAADADGDELTLTWDFGDQAAGAGATPSHTYGAVGTYTATLTVADGRGGSATSQATVRVVYAFGGFLGSLQAPPVLNELDAGRAVGVKFTLGGDYGLAIMAVGYPTSHQISCDAGAPIDAVEEIVPAQSSQLTYKAETGVYQYAWKTSAAWKGTCRQLNLRLADGTEHPLLFRFR